ncbi:GNAT family N-acetyltransferase [Staphylococcus pseudoxylosus]|uniref:GNAT family N-acetyltransferase n=1 Tax=Staphylococcus pseudoxylosus TaxID=2282419 RepID=UPI00298EFD85|nr:GNAT family N-acetyltransferase [Staphylococcus pseudoxylosus]MDW8545501.1 GNAT family N-acetyltransferase [Staphylococcus pseudoxylosus]
MIKQLKSPSSEELDIISKIWLDANLEAHHFINRDYWINNLDQVKKMLPDSTIYVYYVENEIIGFVGLYENDIAGIFIKDSYRNKGIGKLFMEKLKNDYNTLKLYVYEKNVRATRFYLKRHFEIKCKNLEEETQEYEYFMEWTNE